MGHGMFYTIVIWTPVVLGVVPLTRMLMDRREKRRLRPGAHARPGPFAGPGGAQERGRAVRLGVISICGAFNLIARPRGLHFWLVIGAMVVVLLWEAVSDFTDYLVRKSAGEGTTSDG